MPFCDNFEPLAIIEAAYYSLHLSPPGTFFTSTSSRKCEVAGAGAGRELNAGLTGHVSCLFFRLYRHARPSALHFRAPSLLLCFRPLPAPLDAPQKHRHKKMEMSQYL